MGSNSKAVIMGYWYGATVKAGIAVDVDEIYKINAGGLTIWNGSVKKEQGNTTAYIAARNVFGGEKGEGGIEGSLEVRFGDENQQPSGLLQRLLGALIPADRGYVSTVFDGWLTGINPYPKPWEYCVRKHSSTWYPEKSKIVLADGNIIAMNPAHILWESYTNPSMGGKKQPADMDAVAFKAAADTLYNEQFGLCLAWKNSDEVKTFREQVCNHIGAKLYTKSNGLISIRLIRDDYNLDDLPVFDENSGLLRLEYDSTNNSFVPSKIVVTYKDAITFKSRPAIAVNLAVVHSQGGQSIQPMEFKGLPTGELATRVANRELKIKTSSLKRLSIELDRRGYNLEVGQPFIVRSLARKINMVVRAERIAENFLTDGTIKIQALQDVFGLPKVAYIPTPPIIDDGKDTTPSVITDYLIIEAPYRELAGIIDPANLELLDATSCYYFAIASNPKSNCRSYNLAAKVQGGGDYVISEFAGAWCPTAVCAQVISFTDTVIQLKDSSLLDTVEKGSAALINGEIVRIDNIDTVNQKITIGRGCIDTVPATHPIDSTIWFYDGFEAIDATEYTTNLTVETKLVSNTYNAQLELSKATTTPITMKGRQGRPYPPANLKINGVAYPKTVSGDTINITWSHRDRLIQADQLIDTTVGNIDLEEGASYALKVYVDNALIIDKTALTVNSYSIESKKIAEVNERMLLPLNGNLSDPTGATWASYGNQVWDTGIITSKSFRFNTSNYLLCTAMNKLNLGLNDFTIELWCKPMGLNYAFASMISNGLTSNQSNARCFMLYGNGANYPGHVGFGGGDRPSLVSNSKLEIGTWYHLAVCRKNGIVTLYINGIKDNEADWPHVPFDYSANGTAIGRSPWSSQSYLNASINQVIVFKKCMYDGDFTPSTKSHEYNGTDLVDTNIRVVLSANKGGLISHQAHDYNFYFKP